VHVDLRAVEGSAPLVDPVLETLALEGQPERLGGPSPALVGADRLLGASNSSKPNARSTDSTNSSSEAISSTSCSAVQKMWLSSWVNPRIRSSPWSTPERSKR
jgi:hypothetical protein